MPLSPYGVVYGTLQDSPFLHTVDDMTFHFSSKGHLESFLEQQTAYRNSVNISLSQRFHFPVDVPHIADIRLYMRVETKGFYISWKGGEYCTCPENLISSGRRTKKNG